MKLRVAANEVGLLLEGETAVGLDCFQCRQALEAPIGERFVGQWPEMLSWLQLRGVGRQEEEMDALWDLDLLAGMPACTVQYQDDPLGESCTDIPGKGGQHLTEEDCLDGRQEPPLGLASGRTDKATDGEPLVPLLYGSDGALADWCPDPTDEGQEANPMLVGGPELDLGTRVGGPDLLYPVGTLS